MRTQPSKHLNKEELLDRLREQRAQLDRDIDNLSEEIARDAWESRVAPIIDDLVRVVCLACEGAGRESFGGGDPISDPVYTEECETCRGGGYHYGVRFIDPIPAGATANRYSDIIAQADDADIPLVGGFEND